MKLDSLLIFITASVVSTSYAAELSSPLQLVRRQSFGTGTSDIPSQCTSPCQATEADVESCPSEDATCLCTNTIRNNAVNCFDCIVRADPSELGPLQATSDELVNECSQNGTPINSITLSANGKNDANAPGLSGKWLTATTIGTAVLLGAL